MASRLLSILCVFVIFLALGVTMRRQQQTMENFLEFIHIPKNAGTTIENIADEKNVKWGRFKPEHRESVQSDTCSYWHTPPKQFNKDSYYKKDETFCVIRDPVDRMVSEYAYRHKGMSEKNNKYAMNQWLREQLNNRDNTVDGGLNCHFIPQYEFIYDDNGKRTCDNVLRFDNLTNEFNDLMNKHEYDIRLEENKKDNKSDSKLTAKDVDEDNRRMIYHIYKKDYDILNGLKK